MPTLRQRLPTRFLVAAYNFNEGSGTTVTDLSGHGLTGILQGATWTTGGRYGNALSFNGSSSYVDLGNPALLADYRKHDVERLGEGYGQPSG